jgi:hypothetical protein
MCNIAVYPSNGLFSLIFSTKLRLSLQPAETTESEPEVQ